MRAYFMDLISQVAAATGWPRPVCAVALAVLGVSGFWFGFVYLSFGNFLVREVGPLAQQIVWLIQGR